MDPKPCCQLLQFERILLWRRCYHLPCGLQHHSLQQFFGEFSSFCQDHRPQQTPILNAIKQARFFKLIFFSYLSTFVMHDSIYLRLKIVFVVVRQKEKGEDTAALREETCGVCLGKQFILYSLSSYCRYGRS